MQAAFQTVQVRMPRNPLAALLLLSSNIPLAESVGGGSDCSGVLTVIITVLLLVLGIKEQGKPFVKLFLLIFFFMWVIDAAQAVSYHDTNDATVQTISFSIFNQVHTHTYTHTHTHTHTKGHC